jgi:UDP-xylose/UDP-N-acetylglucosamine transporter B4
MRSIAEMTGVDARTVSAVGLTLLGCILNVVTLEYLTRRDAGSGALITFAQFVFIAAISGLQRFRWRGAARRLVACLRAPFVVAAASPAASSSSSLSDAAVAKDDDDADAAAFVVARRIPLFELLTTTAFFFALSVCNNLAFGFRISMVLHTIFRSSQLPVSMLVGFCIVSKCFVDRPRGVPNCLCLFHTQPLFILNRFFFY